MKTIDAIIPTIPGREDSLERLIHSLRLRTYSELNPIVIDDSESCGWGWAKGLERVEGDYVLYACDDQQFVGDGWDQAARVAADQDLIACPRVWLPDGRVESQGGDMEAFAHIIGRPQKDWTPVDYTTVPFLSASAARAIGMLADCHYATDVWVSYRGRQLGYETALRHGFDVVHHREMHGRGAGMSQSDRDGMDVATMERELAKCESSLQEA